MPNLKVLVMGERKIGKTVAIKKAVLNITDTVYVPTIAGKLYQYKNIKNNDIEVWDIGGTDPYPGISDAYCKDVNYLILFGLNQQQYIKLVRNYSPNANIIKFTNQVNFQDFLDSL